MVGTVRYRVSQFFRALTAQAPGEESTRALQTLAPAAQRLFCRQTAQDQRHALAVYWALRRQGRKDPDLLAAALLHDVGKAAAPLPAWQRAVIVLLERLAPRLLARLRKGEPPGLKTDLPKDWHRPFFVHAWHPEVGARWAQEAGCSPLTVALIRRHHECLPNRPTLTEEDALLTTLQAADSVN